MEFVSDLVRKLKPHMAEMIDGLVTGAVKFALLHVDGDVLIEGTARRIKGDFNNGAVANRTIIQSATTGVTSVGLMPGGTGLTANIRLMNGSDAANATALRVESNSIETHVDTVTAGSSALLPHRIKMSTVVKIELATDGEINLTPSKRIKIGNASAAPSDTPSGGGYLFVENGVLKYKGSSGTVTTIAAA
jgi:hypothetical protein